MPTSINDSQVWAQLHQHQRATRQLLMRDLFTADPARFSRFSLSCPGLLLDYSKNRITERTMDLLIELAHEAKLPHWMARMRAGERINISEQRAVLHYTLRADPTSVIHLDGHNVVPDVHAVLTRCYAFAESVRNGTWLGYSGQRIRHVVNIGIGGSDLGPLLVTQALHPYADRTIDIHFVSNVDGQHLASTLADLNPETTLFIIASKSFSTPETLLNAQAAREWFLRSGSPADIAKHFVAISTHREAVTAFGIHPDQMFEFWDWVGGRYSVWSAIGLSVMLAVGSTHFADFLAGARAMDQHFFDAPFAQNMPVILGLLGVWYNTFYQAHTHAIMPYDQSLARLPAFVQQLDMESNGKHVGRDGRRLEFNTGPIIWGEPGVNGQHAFFQLLHQGTRLIPSDFIVPLQSHVQLGQHHQTLLANCFAQTEALMHGKDEAEVLAELTGRDGSEIDRLLPQKVFAGNQPSNTLVLDQVTPYTLGMLLALYEHKVFVQGVIWGINSFDQWGVEYGKQLTQRIAPELENSMLPLTHDASTNGLIDYYRQHGVKKIT